MIGPVRSVRSVRSVPSVPSRSSRSRERNERDERDGKNNVQARCASTLCKTMMDDIQQWLITINHD